MQGLALIQFQVVVAVMSLSEAAYYARTTLSRARPALPAAAAAFRPGVGGVTLQRPYRRLVHAASQRAPYFLYRSPPQHRYAVKHFSPTTPTGRNVFAGAGGPWGVRVQPALPAVPAPARAAPASAPALVQHGAGGLHTIPAPNLSFSEKPIVVIETETFGASNSALEHPRPSYEVTEKYVEPVYQMAKIETPVGFSKTQDIQQPSAELASHLRNSGALQLAAEYGLSAISVPHRPALAHGAGVPPPQHFGLQGFQSFNGVLPQQDLMSSGADSVMIPSHVLYQSDPLFLQKLQQQLLQRFPALEFVPYAAELLPQNQNNEPQAHELFLLENEEVKQPEPFLSSESKNIVQREAQTGTKITLTLPQPFVGHVTETPEPTTGPPPRNLTLELVAAESQPVTTTIHYVIENNTEPQPAITEPEPTQNTTPIYYAQVGQSVAVGNVIASGFYSAMNDIRAAAALEQDTLENPQTTKAPENFTTVGPIITDLKQYFVENELNENKTVTELKPLLEAPFVNPADAVKVAYTLLRTEEKKPQRSQDGAVYAGQIVEASISEDHEFNNQKASFMKRAPIRLYVTDEQSSGQAALASSTPKVTLVKAKTPHKSKLTFDDKTGEPVLRIYASYVDSPAQRQAVTTKLTTAASLKAVGRKPADSWRAAAAPAPDKSQGFDGNQLTKFGLKLRARSDDYTPPFQEYDE